MKGLIIGCGKIGALFDGPNDKEILTHAHAYHAHSQITQWALVDPNEKNLKLASQRWQKPGYASIKLALKHIDPDVVSICTPTSQHFNSINEIIPLQPKFIFCEKPLSSSLEQSHSLIHLLDKSHIPSSINFSRQFDPIISELQEHIKNKTFGNLINVMAIYTKGIMHNGSHLINLLGLLLGELNDFHINHGYIDYDPTDPTLDVWCSYENCPSVHLIAAREDKFSIFDYDFIFEEARWRFFQFGHQVQVMRVRKDPLYEGYVDLDEGSIQNTGLSKAMFNYIDLGLSSLKGGKIKSTSQEALKTQTQCLSMLNQYKKDHP